MKKIFACLTLVIVASNPFPSIAPAQELGADSQIGNEYSFDGTPQEKISESELLKRYPSGKKWRAAKTLRVRGVSAKTSWGFSGEQHVVYTNRYQAQTEVLKNELGEIRLGIEILDVSQQRIVSKQKLRVADFRSQGPIFGLAASKIGTLLEFYPAIGTAIKIAKVLETFDPGHQRLLSKALKMSGFDLHDFRRFPEAMIVENPEPLAGCTFEIVWTNGLGVTLCKQTGGPVDVVLQEKEIRDWAQTTDPLFDFYVMDNLNRTQGDSWTVDAIHGASVLASQGATDSKGGLNLTYLDDTNYEQRQCRNLQIRSGSLSLAFDRDDRSNQAKVDDISGTILYDKSAYLVLMAEGICNVDFKAKSTDHLLFEAKWTRDVDVDFRYEARVISNGK